MGPDRKLELRREALVPLETGELSGVAGGTHVYSDCGCITHGYTCDACPMPTVPAGCCMACETHRVELSCVTCRAG